MRTAGSDEHLLAPLRVPAGEREQCRQPVVPAGAAARQEVVGAAAGRDLQTPVAAGAGGELHQPARLLVQDAELQRAVALRLKRPGEHASVSEPHAAAQRLAPDVRAVPGGGGGACGHRILLAQVWDRAAQVPAMARSTVLR